MGVTVGTRAPVAQKNVTLTILDQTADIRAMPTAEAVTKRQVSVSLVVKLDGKALCVIQHVTVECTGMVVPYLVGTVWSHDNAII